MKFQDCDGKFATMEEVAVEGLSARAAKMFNMEKFGKIWEAFKAKLHIKSTEAVVFVIQSFCFLFFLL